MCVFLFVLIFFFFYTKMKSPDKVRPHWEFWHLKTEPHSLLSLPRANWAMAAWTDNTAPSNGNNGLIKSPSIFYRRALAWSSREGWLTGSLLSVTGRPVGTSGFNCCDTAIPRQLDLLFTKSARGWVCEKIEVTTAGLRRYPVTEVSALCAVSGNGTLSWVSEWCQPLNVLHLLPASFNTVLGSPPPPSPPCGWVSPPLPRPPQSRPLPSADLHHLSVLVQTQPWLITRHPPLHEPVQPPPPFSSP